MSETHYSKVSCDLVYLGTMAEDDSWWEWQEKSDQLGAFFYTPGRDAIWCRAPNTRDDKGGWCKWAIKPNELSNGASWEWDGNIEKPTLRPSLHLVREWHGWMRSGRLVSC